ncbi:Methyl-CpG-binding domain-containing protein 3 [Frankliniella fusca]|uniref:Methyl-CpG-binding domain-containing protein 3 n=1 Tax=Frankliniella fusca TaxID=407009 RepID=A0AAE1H2F2_9NEOP|nr:Methyl-CpG-binding domain-containing protein 3 [Frankliniella fusca]
MAESQQKADPTLRKVDIDRYPPNKKGGQLSEAKTKLTTGQGVGRIPVVSLCVTCSIYYETTAPVTKRGIA